MIIGEVHIHLIYSNSKYFTHRHNYKDKKTTIIYSMIDDIFVVNNHCSIEYQTTPSTNIVQDID
jgi:hypothetical protein